MSNGNGGNNCKETIFHDGWVTSVRSVGEERTFIETVSEAEYKRRLAATKERIAAGMTARWSPARIALSTELMFGHTSEAVDAMDEELHESSSGLTRSEQYADAQTIMAGMLDVGRIANHDSFVSQESLDHLPEQQNPFLALPLEYAQPVAA